MGAILLKHRKVLGIILWILVCMQALFIFAMSAQEAGQSTQTSAQVARIIATATTPGFDAMHPDQQFEVISSYQHMTRKAAHMLEFAMLTGFLTLALHNLERWRGPVIATGAATLYAALDEFHQIWSVGRSAQFGDILIDALGAALGAAAAVVLLYLFRRRARKH